MAHRLLVLGWHNVQPTWAFPESSPGAAVRGFQRQLRLLSRYAHVVPLRPALQDLAARRPLPPRAVALTFDDGYLDNVTVAAPLLRSRGLPATFFLVPGFLAGSSRAWWEDVGWAFSMSRADELRWGGERFDLGSPSTARHALDRVTAELKRVRHVERVELVEELLQRLEPAGRRSAADEQFMGWDGAEALVRSGHDVGSHTCTHPILSRESPARQREELAESRRLLEARLDRGVDVLALPNGRQVDYDEVTLRLLAETGYRFALTTRAGLTGPADSPLEVRRVLLEPETDVRAVLTEVARATKRAARR